MFKTVLTSRRKDKNIVHEEESKENYDHETVLILLQAMFEVGYGQKQKQKRSMKQIIELALDLV